jgi:spoIIIJ-associated protein
MISDQIKETVEQMLTKLGVVGSITVQEREQNYYVSIDTEDSALLIGRAGETLAALQTIVRLLVFKLTSQEVRVTVDVNGYRRQQEENLLMMVDQVAQRVKEAGIAETLRPMSAYERRLVHEVVGQVDGVESISTGEGHDRRITIKPVI